MVVTKEQLKGFVARAQAAEEWAARLEEELAELRKHKKRAPKGDPADGIKPAFKKQLITKLSNLKKIVKNREVRMKEIRAENISLTKTKQKLEYRMHHLVNAIKEAQDSS